MNNLSTIRLTGVKLSDKEDIAMLIEAAENLRHAGEANFKEIQGKRCYKRLWDMLTFSKDNEKCMAKNVATLSQMLDIIGQALLLSSKENPTIADYLASNGEQLADISGQQDALAKVIAQMKYGHILRQDICGLPEEWQSLIVSTVRCFVSRTCDSYVNENIQKYLGDLRRICRAELEPDAEEFDSKKLACLDIQSSKLLATMLYEAAALIDECPRREENLIAVMRAVCISVDECSAIKKRVSETLRLEGAESIASRYTDIPIYDELPSIDGDCLSSSSPDIEDDTPTSTDAEDVFPLPDDTAMQYPALRQIVQEYLPKVTKGFFADSRADKQEERIKAFIAKHALQIEKDTAIAVFDTTQSGNGEKGFLFTTHAIYFAKALEQVVELPYAKIAYSECKLVFNEKGHASAIRIADIHHLHTIEINDSRKRDAGLTVVITKGSEHNGFLPAYKVEISMEEIGIKPDAMLNMLNAIGKLQQYAPTDRAVSINEMASAVKMPFTKLLINFLTTSGQSWAEVLRYAADLPLDEAHFDKLVQYVCKPNESVKHLLREIDNNVPYGSRKSLRYALVTELFKRLQFTKHNTELAAPEHEFIQAISTLYGFNGEMIASLKKVAQIEYGILTGDIKSVMDLQPFQEALTVVMLATGGASFLNIRQLGYVPVIGPVLPLILSGVALIRTAININQMEAEFIERRRKMVLKELHSYKSIIDKLQGKYVGMEKELALLMENSYSIKIPE